MQAFEPKTLTIAELFGNQDSLYKIPRYQRPYKWEGDQVEQLWDDIYSAYEDNISNYFLGSIITAKDGSSIDIIDGQQRMTTLMIFFCVLRDVFPNINQDSDNPDAIDRDTIENFIYYKKKFERLTLLTDPQHRGDLDSLIINGSVYDLKKPFKYEIKKDEKPKFKFINTALIFKEKLEEVGEESIGEFINYLFNNVSIIRIDCVDRGFAIKLFQVLNDRGMDLTSSDLIKSFLLQKIEDKYKNENEDMDKKDEEDQFIAEWRKAENILLDTDLSMNEMFIVYEYYLLAQNPKKSLSDELQDLFKDGDANTILHDFVEFSETYRDDIYKKEARLIYSFWYLRWSVYWKSILLASLHNGYRNHEELLFVLRRFYYLYWIAGKTLSKVKQLSFNIIKWVKENKSIEFIKDEINKKLEADNILVQVKENLSSDDIYNTAWSKPLLLLIEYGITDDSKLSFIELTNDLHLEHILPKKYKTWSEWNHITDEMSNDWLNSAGNLTLLSGKKNIEASNNPFKQKISVYKGKGKYKDKDTSITAFEMTKQIVNDFEQKRYNEAWNEQAMQDRYDWFCEKVEDLLGISCGEQ
jgi:uncharacterized protein with ParB-like and HNH nuclease domain